MAFRITEAQMSFPADQRLVKADGLFKPVKGKVPPHQDVQDLHGSMSSCVR
jgi:hypothetical protein